MVKKINGKLILLKTLKSLENSLTQHPKMYYKILFLFKYIQNKSFEENALGMKDLVHIELKSKLIFVPFVAQELRQKVQQLKVGSGASINLTITSTPFPIDPAVGGELSLDEKIITLCAGQAFWTIGDNLSYDALIP